MKLTKTGIAGTMESSDAYVEVAPGQNGVEIQLESTVMGQFGKHISSLIQEVAKEQGLEDVQIKVMDKGALDCTLKARVLTAICRATDRDFNWE
ncbi:MAG: citrate lyase acyl carrier protein [Sphaerochaetaceae bacterium]|nr:citrate lyase acyl carrier protein [Sphaerochaetaceae bacterium]